MSMSFSSLLFTFMGNFLSLMTLFLYQNSELPAHNPTRHGLQVQLFLPKANYIQGEPIEIHAEFENVGENPIKVGTAIYTGGDAPFRLAVTIEDAQGRPKVIPAQDSPEMPCMDLREADPNHPTTWKELLPGSKYSTTVTLSARTSEKLNPGLYKLRGRYRSYGLLVGGHCYKSFYPKEVISSGIEWRGEVTTNAVSLRILSNHDTSNQ
jgi:hypothetical protein